MKDSRLAEFQGAWPQWRVWRTTAGTLMATRRRDLSDAELAAGLAMTLPAGVCGPSLPDQLAEQAAIEERLSARLI